MAKVSEAKRAYMARWRAQNRAQISAYNKAYATANRDELLLKKAVYRQEHRAEINAYARDYYAKNIDSRLAYAEKYRRSNAELLRLACAEWRAKYPERQARAVKAWRVANPEANVRHNNLRRARIARTGGRLTRGVIARLMDAQLGLCAYCHASIESKRHLDHKTPLSRGGANVEDNVQLTCPTCNLRKHAKTDEEFIACLR